MLLLPRLVKNSEGIPEESTSIVNLLTEIRLFLNGICDRLLPDSGNAVNNYKKLSNKVPELHFKPLNHLPDKFQINDSKTPV